MKLYLFSILNVIKFYGILMWILLFLCGCVFQKEVLSYKQIVAACLKEKKMSKAPQSEVTVFKGRNQTKVGISVSISSNFLDSKDPKEVYRLCLESLSN